MWSVPETNVPRGSRPDPACGSWGRDSPVTSVSRQTIYRVKLSVRRVPKPESEPGAAMKEIADWLKKLGMSEYAQRFAENGIDVSALPHLTDQDLKDIGVLLGHRRKMLAAISQLAGAAPASLEPATRPSRSHRNRRAPPSHGDVLGPSRFDSIVCPHGPGGPARHHSRRRFGPGSDWWHDAHNRAERFRCRSAGCPFASWLSDDGAALLKPATNEDAATLAGVETRE